MLSEAEDFREESRAIAALLKDQPEDVFQQKTLFKEWTVEDIIAHLHLWNFAALKSLEGREAFQAFAGPLVGALLQGNSHSQVQKSWLDEAQSGVRGRALFGAWVTLFEKTSDEFKKTDPDERLAWAGPDMSARACIIARQMESWAHAQAIYDLLGVQRATSKRLKNIAQLGVMTYSWAFKNRGMAPPTPKPYVQLDGPNGEIWAWNDPQADNKVSGDALEFCQVVTQTRNIADTNIDMIGDTAKSWMAIAQCFAGPPEEPPAAGLRRSA
ncbi:MAG: TIGR03084 family metal-binding protein [Pseudomonadota bacterium]